MSAAPAGHTLLETRRLRLRRITPVDTARVTRLNGDPRVMRYIAPCAPPAETQRWLTERVWPQYETDWRFGWFVVEEQAPTAPDDGWVGLAALKPLSSDNHAALGPLLRGATESDIYEIGWRFFEACWGRGYATECGRALVDLALSTYRLPRICAVALAENTASCRAIEKCGLTEEGVYQINGRPARFFTRYAGAL